MFLDDVSSGDPIEADFINALKREATRQIGGGTGTFAHSKGMQVGEVRSPPWFWGKLDEALVAKSSATASVYSWSESSSDWVDTGLDLEVYAPPTMATLVELALGEWIRIVWAETDGGRWEILDTSSPLMDARFELKDALSPGSNATAYVRRWNGSAWEVDTDIEIEVYDVDGMFRGRAKDAYSSPHNDGSRGIARYISASSHWEIMVMQPHALWLVGDVYADFADTDSTFEIDGVEVAFPVGGLITDTDPAANITVYNIHGWDGDANAKAEVRWNENQDRWECTELDCT